MCEILNEYKRDEGSFLEIFEEFSKVVDGGEMYFSLKRTKIKKYIKIKKVSFRIPFLKCQAEVYEVFENRIECIKGDYEINLQSLLYQNWTLSESSEEDFLAVKEVYNKPIIDRDLYKGSCKYFLNKEEIVWENVNKIIEEFKRKKRNDDNDYETEHHLSYVKYDFDTLAKIVNLHPVGKYVKIISDRDSVFYGKFDSIYNLELIYISNMIFDDGLFLSGSQHRFIKTIKSIVIISETEYLNKLNEVIELYKF